MERRRLLDIPQINPGNREEKVQVVSRLSVRDLGDREEIGR